MRRLTVHWLALMGLCFCVAGCTTTQKDEGVDDATRRSIALSKPLGLLIEPQPAAEVGYRIGWSSPIKLLEGQRITSVTVLGDMVVIVEDPLNMVTALRASDGELMWKITLGSELEKLFAPSRDEDQIFIHSATRMFTLRTRNGEATAAAPLQTPVSAPAVYSELTRLMVMSGVDGTVFAHGVDSNFTRWAYKMANRISSSPMLAGQDVFIVDTGGTYAMLETKSGLILWRNHTLGEVSTSPALQDSEVIVASADGKLYALNRTTGRDTWIYLDAEQPLIASPTVLGRLVLLPLSPNNGMVAIDSINGEELWRTERTATPILARQQDMLMHTDDTLVSIDLNTGNVLSEVTTKPIMTVKPMDDGGLLLVNASGQLLKLSPTE